LKLRPAGDPVREAVLWYGAAALAAVLLVSLAGVWLFRRAGEEEAIRDARDQTRIAAEASIEPAVDAGVLRGDAQALAELDRVVQERILADASLVRVKLWDRTGRIVYSDEPRLIGTRYPLSAHDLEEFEQEQAQAEVTDLTRPENRFERQFGRLLEVYMPIEGPSGEPLRYEAYYRSSFVSARGDRIFRQFAPPLLGGLVLLALIQLPLAWQLARRVRRSQEEREALLQRAVDASDHERRRIAQDLHDGVVQDLTAVSYSLSAAAATAPEPVDGQLRDAAAETRRGIRHLRTLLVDIYPPELHRAGLAAALADLLTGAEARGVATSLDVDPTPLGADQEALLFRVAQEAVRNVVKHAGASRLDVRVHRVGGHVRLEVEDDGCGFDPAAFAGEGHIGLRVLADLVAAADGTLEVESRPGEGARVAVELTA
jgi:signal transduction histidine kinase